MLWKYSTLKPCCWGSVALNPNFFVDCFICGLIDSRFQRRIPRKPRQNTEPPQAARSQLDSCLPGWDNTSLLLLLIFPPRQRTSVKQSSAFIPPVCCASSPGVSEHNCSENLTYSQPSPSNFNLLCRTCAFHRVILVLVYFETFCATYFTLLASTQHSFCSIKKSQLHNFITLKKAAYGSRCQYHTW